MGQKKLYKTSLLVVLCVFVNYAGRILAETLELPVWLDTIGTVFAAYALGPVCGAMVGAALNVVYGLHDPMSWLYGFTSIAVGVIVGISAKKGAFDDLFGVLSTALTVTVVSVFVSVPINFFYKDGYTGNIWGDGVIGLFQEIGFNRILSCIMGQFYLVFLDRVITMLLCFLVIRLIQNRKGKDGTANKGKRSKSAKSTLRTMIFALPLCVLLASTNTVCAHAASDWQTLEEFEYQGYVQTVYNGQNGLTGGTANDIAQTKDGVLWIGTYGGLYRYSGNQFQWMNDMKSVKTVNCLFTDESGRLWIGTNDNGLSICINQNITNVINRSNGLPSNSVRCIAEDSQGNYYVGTTSSLVVMKLSDGLKVHETIPEVVNAISVCADQNGNVAAVTDEGKLYVLHGTEVIAERTLENGDAYNCCAFDQAGNLYAGGSADAIDVYRVAGTDLKASSSLPCGALKDINALCFSEENELMVCADNGAGYLNDSGEIKPIDTGSFNNSFENTLFDYQGNIWFVSSRLGLLHLSPSVFREIHGKEDSSDQVVNTTAQWQGCLYMGTDDGLDISSDSASTQITDDLTERLRGTRIRCLMVDSAQNLWIGTFGQGLWKVSPAGEIVRYDSDTGALGNNFRSIIETTDGGIVAAGDSGVTYLQNGVATQRIGAAEGLENPKVLSLLERDDGSILAGTDGNGIAVLKDGVVKETLNQEDRLSSDIIIKMVRDANGDGVFVVTGNGLCYMDHDGRIRTLDAFPYYNNYDIVQGSQDELFVLSSAGIYVVDRSELLEGNEVSYTLLDARRGLQTALTPNAWNCLDDNGDYYMSGTTGVVCMNLNQYEVDARSYRMLLQSITVDGISYPMEKGEAFHIVRDAERIRINPEIVNYSVNEPVISIWLEGFEKEPRIVSPSEAANLEYTNLRSGSYTFHVAVLDSKTGKPIAENTYQIVKDREIYDNGWFLIYVAIVSLILTAYLTWLIVRKRAQKMLLQQQMKLELAEKQLQMGNETIMTIAQTVDAKDENTSQHSIRVSEYSVLIAKKLGMSDEECENLRKIAVLHDIGKIGIPDRVLNKPGRLTDEEYAIMKSHVTKGADILKSFTLIDHVAEGALYHHERYDGRGYVHGLKGEEIPLYARIIGIADAFDAMTANRVYRSRLDFGYVLEELRKGRGTQFDPALVDILLGLIDDGTIDVGRIYEAKGSEASEHEE
ncbi:HD domain-containing phosphohydrolase [Xiamenia xianingshaonis]|uniref:HD domain-containing protein n=1 Tax=Xiamenia xianingshaonis TaxID=2682776 RepID=A0A9E6SVE4_9ACTN|nr:HD domain-containing phosphohydrolase [Xiamenia xianingshaonis]NHM13750.1 HD domain-containing protein [Xiamenia xianingshaonis]QTU85117.1 HD domain-containing protein [Xiamenia xianingshaonis]